MITWGTSEWAIALGLQRTRHDGFPFMSELELWSRLSGLLPRYASLEERDSPDAECGRWMEIVCGHRYAKERGLRWGPDICQGPEFPKPGLVHPAYPFLSTRPDFFVPGLERVMEAKTPRRLDEERWGPAGTDQVPADYAVQVLGQLTICHALWGTELADLAAFARAPGWGADRVWAVYHLRRDPVVERQMLDRLDRWWHHHVVDGNPPLPDGSPSATAALQGLWKGVEPCKVAATPDMEEQVYRLIQTKTAQRELAARRAEAEQRIKLWMGEATELVDQQGARLATWRPDVNDNRRFKLWVEDVGVDDEG